MNPPQPIQDWLCSLGSTDPAQVEDAMENLVKAGCTAVPALIDALYDGDAVICARAIETLGAIGDTQALDPIIGALGDTDAQVVLSAINALRRLGDVRAVPALLPFLRHDDIYVHFYTTLALSELRHQETVDALLALQPSGKFARAGFEPRQCPVEPGRCRDQSIFKFRLTHGRYCPQDATIPSRISLPQPLYHCNCVAGRTPGIPA